MSQFKSDVLNDLQARGFIYQTTNIEILDQKLQKPLTFYVGFDPTGDSLHIGHLVPILMARKFQQAGHKPIIIVGGGTARVGDPSGKDQTRKMLDDAQIKANTDAIIEVYKKFIEFDSGKDNAALIVNNADWLDKLDYIGFLRDYGKHFTINRMLTFESVKGRLDREAPLTFLEFNYMILQAYDFLELYRRHECILELGGSDQWGNILNGTELIRREEGGDAYGMTAPLITTSSGAKMGKTADGAIWLNDDKLSAFDFWQYWRNTEDADVIKFMKLFTDFSLDEIAEFEKLEGADINEAKKQLANAVTTLCRGQDEADKAQEMALTLFEKNELSEDLPSIILSHEALESGKKLIDLFIELALCQSKGEAKRLIKGRGAKLNDTPITDDQAEISASDFNKKGQAKLSAGKKKHALVKL